jgi:hypothetical protein
MRLMESEGVHKVRCSQMGPYVSDTVR